jgi:hypothetical protein
MKLEKLPQELLEILWEHGMASRLIYVPKQKSQTLIARYTPRVLEDIEANYEARGITFYWEASPRRGFSMMFGTKAIVSKFQLKPRTATRVALASWKAWREWFSHRERIRLEQLRTIAEESGCEYTDLFLSYREIRSKIRSGQDVDVQYFTGYHGVSEKTIQQVIDLARASIESCPWRPS